MGVVPEIAGEGLYDERLVVLDQSKAAGEAPRLEHVGSATPTGKKGVGGGKVIAESGIPEKVIEELIRRGHKFTKPRTNGGGYQGILIDPTTGMLHGGSEARKDGCAVGY